MRINLNYLQTLVPFTGDIGALAELLESVGIEVDRIEPTPAGNTLEFDITPNRPDWLCHLGIAREVVAKHAELALRPLPGGELPSVSSAPALPVRVEDGAACPRYCGALLGDVRVEPSPPEVARLLESLGLRPINNLVDISNLVMMTLGQPMHFFDAGCLTGPEVVVRRARAGEKLVLLDQRELTLSEEALVIADRERPVALAGVMGGLDSGITGATRSLFIESALFAPRVIRRTARRYGLRSDASFRYERGTDPALPPLSMMLALHWLEKLTGEKPAVTSYVDVAAAPQPAPVPIEMDKGFPGRFSGMPLDPQTCAAILKRLCFAVEDLGAAWRVTAPSFRVDVAGKEDLVEEITRIHGYDKLPTVVPVVARGLAEDSPHRRSRERARDHLVYGGFCEACNWVFLAPEENLLFQADPSAITLKNPLGREYSEMRGSLLPPLLRNAGANLRSGESRVALFECGRTFAQAGGEIVERDRLALVLAGQEALPSWRTPAREVDLFSLESTVMGLGERLGWQVSFGPATRSGSVPGRALEVFLRRAGPSRLAGWLGEIGSEVLARYDIERPVFAAELDLTLLSEATAEPGFVPWNRQPLATRDFSFLLPARATWGDFSGRLAKVRPPELETIGLVDLYRGKNVPVGTVSMTVAFAYRAEGRTLSGEEITTLHTRLTERLTADLGLMPRTIQGVKS